MKKLFDNINRTMYDNNMLDQEHWQDLQYINRPKPYGVYKKGTLLHTGTFESCWNYLHQRFAANTIAELRTLNIRIQPYV